MKNTTFLDLLGESIIIQSLITVAVLGAWLFLIVTRQPVPIELTNVLGLVIGFFFGGKYALAMKNASSQAAAASAAAVTIAAKTPPTGTEKPC